MHQTRRPRVGRTLQFQDSDGVRWNVTEYARDEHGVANGQACLIFESDFAVRRVRTFPANWRELGETALAALSWQV